MITAGIDIGAKNVKVVVVRNGEVVGRSDVLGGFEQAEAAEEALKEALEQAGLNREDVEKIGATGVGRKVVEFADKSVTEVGAAAKGASYLIPSARTVIDVGAEEGRGIKVTPEGKVFDFAVNERCAAGAGSFIEAMARALEITVEEMGSLSLHSTKSVPMNAQCAVFAESEVVSLVHAKTSKEDIARAVTDAIASRITSMVRRVGVEKDVVLIGGLANSVGFINSMKETLNMDVLVPEQPSYVGAIGAAILVAE